MNESIVDEWTQVDTVTKTWMSVCQSNLHVVMGQLVRTLKVPTSVSVLSVILAPTVRTILMTVMQVRHELYTGCDHKNCTVMLSLLFFTLTRT